MAWRLGETRQRNASGRAWITSSLIAASIVLLVGLTIPVSAEGCSVSDGESLQSALDDAEPYTELVVCEGTYNEKVTIAKDGIQLVGNGSPTLDGELLSEGHAITLAEDVRDVTISGFEITGYDPLIDGNVSSGIASGGHVLNVTVRDNTITNNAWAGIMLVGGDDLGWTITNNTLQGNGFAQVLAHDATAIEITDNELHDGTFGLLLAGTEKAQILSTTVNASGEAGIAIAPSLGEVESPTGLTIEDTTVTGNAIHGLWAADIEQGQIVNNTFTAQTASHTIGADAAFLSLYNNTGIPAVHVTNTTAVHQALGQAPDGATLEEGLTSLSIACPLEVNCTTDVVAAMFTTATNSALNPLAEAEYNEDAQRLAACNDQGDDCLRNEFIHAEDGRNPRTWEIPYPQSAENRSSDPWTESTAYRYDFNNYETFRYEWIFSQNAQIVDTCFLQPPAPPYFLALAEATLKRTWLGDYNYVCDASTATEYAYFETDLPYADRITFTFHHGLDLPQTSSLTGTETQVSVDIRLPSTEWTTLASWGPEDNGGWRQESLDLSAFEGLPLQIQFRYDPPSEPWASGGEGWFIDKLNITASTLDVHPGLEAATVEFIDVAARAQGETPAWRYHDDTPLEQEWTPLVLCRLHIDESVLPCEGLPRAFDYGLPIHWRDSNLSQRFSEWRLKLPTQGTFESFERVHGPDATLFRAETTPHHGGRTLPSQADRVHHAGGVNLTCRIVPGPSVDPSTTDGCGSPPIAAEPVDHGTAWCPTPRPAYAADVHEDIGREAERLWDWSQSCDPGQPQPYTASWASFLEYDRADLESAQTAYADADTASGRENALEKADTALEKSLERRAALTVGQHGMPATVSETTLGNVTARELDTELPYPVLEPSTVWTGDEALIFWPGRLDGSSLSTEAPNVIAFDPVTEAAKAVDTPYPADYCCTASIWTGETVLLFGGRTAEPEALQSSISDVEIAEDGATNLIQEYDPRTETITTVGALPRTLADAKAVWHDTAWGDCSEGCAFVFAPDGEILRYEAETRTTSTMTETLPSGIEEASIAWTGQEALIFPPGDNVTRYRPFGTISTDPATVPTDTAFASAVWDGERAHVLGGTNGDPSSSVHVYNANEEDWTAEFTLPHRTAHHGAIWDGRSVYTLGGDSGSGSETPQQAFRIFNYTLPYSAWQDISDLHSSASAYEILPLSANPGDSNIDLRAGYVFDTKAGNFVPVEKAGLLIDQPARLVYNVTYDAVNGERLTDTIAVDLPDRKPSLSAPVSALLGDELATRVLAWDDDYSQQTANLDDRRQRRIHTAPLLNLTDASGAAVDEGVFQAGASLAKGESLTACVRELFTGRADGLQSNVNFGADGADRLAIDSTSRCTDLVVGEPERIAADVPLSLSLQLREGHNESVELTVVHDPTKHPLDKDAPNENITLAEASTYHAPSRKAAAVEPVSARLIVTVPENGTPEEHAQTLTTLLEEHAGTIGVFSVEIDDLPAPQPVKNAVENATKQGSTVLVGAGTLPDGVHDWKPEDKLMTVHGLAQLPQVITVGAASQEEGIADWTRRGPSPSLFGPKPDLVAPSPTGSTIGAVQNALPYLEALHAQGLYETELLRVVLTGYALPVENEAGAPATWWEQGAGMLDLGRFLQLPTTSELIQRYEAQNGVTDGAQHLALTLNTTPASIEQAAPSQLLGAAGNTTGLVRAGVSHSLVNLTLDSPALPSTSIVDYGVTNHETSKRATLDPIDLDPLVNATVHTLRAKVIEAGYTQTEADAVMGNLSQLFTLVAEEGQRVTVNITHYRFEHTLKNDLLYTGLDALVDTEIETNALDPAPAQTLKDRLSPWLLEDHHLVEEQQGTVHLPVEVDEACPHAPVEATLSIADTARTIIASELGALAGTIKADAAQAIASQLPEDPRVVSEKNEGFVTEQARQLACLEDQKRILEEMRGWANKTRELERVPYGAWNQTEALTGAWNRTPIGGQLATTVDTLNTSAHALAENSTLVMDTTITALDRALALTEDELDMLKLPRIEAKEPTANTTDVMQPPTSPQRTQQAPLGGYAGLALLTSHDVTVHDPIRGENITQRDITIPLPSLLWNNPTLEWTEQYRDATPIDGTALVLDEGGSNVNLTVNFTVYNETEDVYLALGTNRLDRWDAETNYTENLSQALAAVDEASLGPFAGVFEEANATFATSLQAWLNATACPDAARGELKALCQEATQRAFRAVHDSLWSRDLHHEALTNETGQARLGQLYPASYNLLTPYPYPLNALLDQDYDYANTGRSWLDGSLADIDKQIAQGMHEQVQTWPQHHSARQAEENDVEVPSHAPNASGIWDAIPYVEIHDSGEGPFHPFAYNITGVDLLGVSCLDQRWFAEQTQTPLAAPGCQALPVDTPLGSALTELQHVADCLQGASFAKQAISQAQREDCAEVAAALQACQEDVACDEDRLSELAKAVEALQAAAGGLVEQTTGRVLFAHARSPARVAQDDQADIGYDCPALRDASQALDANADANLSDEAWCDAIDEAIDEFTHPQAEPQAGIEVDEPEREANYTHVTAQGVLHQITDRVSGLDWFHVGSTTGDPLEGESASSDEQKILDLIQDAGRRLENGTDREDVHDLAAELDERVDASETVAAFNGALLQNATQRAQRVDEGWRANGSVSNGAYTLDGDAQHQVLSDADACGEMEETGLVPESYLECATVESEVGPSTQALSNVDTIPLANALLEQLRQTPAQEASPEQLLGVLSNATRVAAGPSSSTVHRSEQTFRVEQNDTATVPLAGALYYTTPLPVNEDIQLRMDGQLLLEDTAALVVHTPNPAVTEAMLAATELWVDPNQPVSGVHNVVSTLARFDDLLDVMLKEGQKDPLVRAELYGFPLTVEQQSNLAIVNEHNASLGADEDCGTGVPSGEQAASDLCSRGLLTARPDGFYNLSRVYEFHTKGRGGTFGPSFMHTLVVYFPSSTGAADPQASSDVPSQKLVLDDFSLQMKMFQGIESAMWDFDLTERFGYRANVENFNQLWAVPNQPLANQTDPGLQVRFTGAGADAPWQPQREDLIAAPGSIGTTSCPRTNAPGYTTDHIHEDLSQNDTRLDGWMRTGDRGPSNEAGLYYHGYRQPCETNTVEGARPRHVPADATYREAWMTSPEKKPADALQYQFNVDTFERFAQAVEPDGPAWVHPLNWAQLSTEGMASLARSPQPVPSWAPDVDAVLEQWPGVDVAPATSTLDNPLFKLENATPFVNPSWQSEQVRVDAGARSVHNYVVMDEQQTLALMEDPWNPLESFDRRDLAATSVDEVIDLDTSWVKGHRLPLRNTTDEQAGVLAHRFQAHVDQAPHEGDAGLEAIKAFQTLIGNGRTGAGVAIEITASHSASGSDANRSSFLAGQSAGGSTHIELEVHKLGGNKTAGSDCFTVDLYSYVEPYYRCTGLETTRVVTDVYAVAGADCYDAALDAIGAAHRHAVSTSSEAVDGETWFRGTSANHALDRLTGPLGPGDLADPLAPRTEDRITGYSQETATLTRAALTVLTCVQQAAWAQPVIGSEPIDRLRDDLQDLVDELLDGNVTDRGLNVTKALDEVLYEYGEPEWALEAVLDAPFLQGTYLGGDSTSTNTGSRTEETGWAVEVWNLPLDQAHVDLVEHGDQTVEQRLDTIENVDEIYTANETISYEHGNSYDLSIEATDTEGASTGESASVLVDLFTPNATWLDAPIGWVNDTYTVSGDIYDDVSGLEELVINPALSCCSRTVALDTDQTTFAETFNFRWTLHGESFDYTEVRILDEAGNEKATKLEGAAIDLQPPDIVGQILTDLDGVILYEPLEIDLDVDDWDAGLGTVEVELVDASTGEVVDTFRHSQHHRKYLSWDALALDIASPTTTYKVRVTAEDRVGNQATRTIDKARTHLLPELDLHAPGNATQQMIPFDYRLRGETWIPGFNQTPVDLIAKVTDEEGATVAEIIEENVTGSFDVGITSLANAKEEQHNFSVEVKNGDTGLELRPEMLVDDGVSYQQFERPRAYGELAAGEAERWAISIETVCVEKEYQGVGVASYAHDVDLYLDSSAPEGVGTNPQNYDKSYTGDRWMKFLYNLDVQATEVHTALVHAPENATDQYRVAYWTWCYDDPRDPQPPGPPEHDPKDYIEVD